jgi:hypothetical protein
MPLSPWIFSVEFLTPWDAGMKMQTPRRKLTRETLPRT